MLITTYGDFFPNQDQCKAEKLGIISVGIIRVIQIIQIISQQQSWPLSMKYWTRTDYCEAKSALPYYGAQQAEWGRDKLNGDAHKCVRIREHCRAANGFLKAARST